MSAIAIQNEQHWHELRKQNIGASEVAALFNASPYTTKKILWHEKAGEIERGDFGNERMTWGNRLEQAIAEGIAEDQEWQIRKVRRYLTHPTVKGMGASLDYEIYNHPDGVACFEVKNVDWLQYRDKWEETEAPIHIELQLQHQMAVRGTSWGAIGVLIGGNESAVIIRKRNDQSIAIIEKAVSDFWASIEAGEAPKVENPKDINALKLLYPENFSEIVPAESAEFDMLCDEYKKHSRAEKSASDAKTIAAAKLIEMIKENEGLYGDLYKATYKLQRREESITKAYQYRKLNVTERKTK